MTKIEAFMAVLLFIRADFVSGEPNNDGPFSLNRKLFLALPLPLPHDPTMCSLYIAPQSKVYRWWIFSIFCLDFEMIALRNPLRIAGKTQ
jgi:hypothetical protein